jgi:hypothetical protein
MGQICTIVILFVILIVMIFLVIYTWFSIRFICPFFMYFISKKLYWYA